MGLAIFQISSWDVVEPVTWVVQSTWMTIGAFYFLVQKSDMNERIMFPHFQQKKYDKLLEQKNFDTDKERFLEELIHEIEQYNSVLGIKYEEEAQ